MWAELRLLSLTLQLMFMKQKKADKIIFTELKGLQEWK